MSKAISNKQLAANRNNAKLGGVKTAQGKAISKLNAMKHGLLSKEVLLDGEDEESLIELGKRLRVYFQPVGEFELILTERIIANTWRLKLALRVENQTMEWQREQESNRMRFGQESSDQIQREAIKGMITNDGVEKIVRYETAIERSLYKALHELQRIQAVRAGDKPLVPLAVDVDVSK